MVAVHVSNEARGRLRLLGARLETDARRVELAVDRLPRPVLRDLAMKGPVGRDRALAKLLPSLQVRPFHFDGRSFAIRYLRPETSVPSAVGALDDPSDHQRAVIIWAAMIAGGVAVRKAFGAGATFHALGRLLDRSQFKADPVAALFEAHDFLLALGPIEGGEVFKLPELLLPAADGAFVIRPRQVGHDASPMALATTWLPSDMLRDQQVAHVTQWQTMLAQARRARFRGKVPPDAKISCGRSLDGTDRFD